MQSLESKIYLVIPPVPLHARVIRFLSLQKAGTAIVVPLWTLSSFWPLLTSKYKQFMKGCLVQNGAEALTRGSGDLNSFLGSDHLTCKVVAFTLEFL